MKIELFIMLVTVLFVVAITIPLLLHYRKVSGAYAKKEGRQTATAVIQSVRDANVYINNKPEFEFELLVQLPDGSSRTVKNRRLMEFSEMTAFQPGSIVQVSYGKENLSDLYIEGYASIGEGGFEKLDFTDPASMEKIAPMLDILPEGTKATVLSALETYKRAMSGDPAEGYADAMKQFPGFVVSPVDTAEEIRKLAELRDQGILTEEEFTAKKRQLLQI